MCTVDKLLIKGIRSFSPDNEHIIAFYKPLTLIVGHNGAGKTTIIECLKQATTGALPPTVRSGHSFIHDPQVAGESVVKAQIKLRINNISDAPMVVIRCFQLAQMKSRKEYKALDQTIQTMNMQTGEMEASSYRCVDINKIVPMVMGVSKPNAAPAERRFLVMVTQQTVFRTKPRQGKVIVAILENVIFVHQEDSNWPLADPSELKKRFDDIFAATKYTQAMKAMKELVKDKGQLVRECWLKMEHLKTIRDQAHLRQEQLRKAKLQGRELREEVEKLEPKIQRCEAELQDAESGLARLAQLDARIQQLQDRRQVQAAHEAGLAARAPDISSPTAEIEQRLQQFEDEVADLEAQQQVLARAAQDDLSRIQALRSELLEQTKALSRLEADRSNHQRALDELNVFIQQLAITTGMTRPGSEIASPSDDRVQECRRHIDAQLQAAEGELEASRSAHRRQEQEVQAEVNAVDAELGSIEEKVQVLEQQMKGNSARMKDVSQRITSILATHQDVQDALDREAELAKAVEAKSRALQESGLPALMEETAQQLRAVREKESGVKQELSQLNQIAEEAAAVSSKQKDVARMAETLQSRLLAAQPELLDVLGDTSAASTSGSSMPASALAVSSSFSGAAMPAADELHGVVSARQAVVASQLSQHRARLQTLRTDLSMKQGELKAASAQLQDHQQEQQQLEAEIQATLQRHTQPDDQENLQLQERMAAVQEKHDLAQDAAAQLAATVKLSEGWKREGSNRRRCGLCRRQFADDGEAQAYQDRIDHLLRSAPERERQQKQELALLKQQVDALRSLEPRFARHLELKNTLLPKEEEAARQLREQSEALEQQLEGLQQEEAELQRSVQQLAEVMEGTVWPIHSMQQELEAGRAQLQKLQDRLGMMGVSGRAQDAVRQELEALEKQRADLESKQGHMQQEQMRIKEQQQQLTMQHHAAKQRLLEVRGQHERKADLEAQMRSLSAETEQLRSRVADSIASRPQLEQKLVRLRGRQEAVLEETREEERAVEAKVRAARTAKDALAARVDAALQWSRRGKEEQLSQAEARVRQLQASVEKGEAAHADQEQQRSDLASSLANTAELKASLKDCLAARKAQEEKEKTDRELQAVQAELRGAGKRQRLTEQTAALKEEVVRQCSRRDHLKGMELEVGRRMAEVEAGLAEPQYKDIEARYRQKLVELKTTEMANKDLERYQKAVERALLSFHTTKMADVNAIIKELWQKTYMNQDIDFIQIKADGDQKSYSYRVVMNSGGTELEMRGRCSAGQKVLASLIIRLALAETFCLKCGILALDEPTTNLDAANSASLADALKALMLSRREQSNFQLVVITHDEAFATMIGTREHTEYLWRVTKDDAGHSHIAREAINLAE